MMVVIEKYLFFSGTLNHNTKLVIAGNHDIPLDKEYYEHYFNEKNYSVDASKNSRMH